MSADEVPIGVVEIPIGVCGSRRAVPISNQAPRNEVFAEETSTVIVFPHGAVIRLSAPVAPGQMMMVANRKSAQVIPCRVVKAKNYPNVRGYAEIEFFRSTKGFWGPYAPQGTLKRMARALPGTSQIDDFWSSDLANEAVSFLARPALGNQPVLANSVIANRATASPVTPLVSRNKVESIQSQTIHSAFVKKPAQRKAKAPGDIESSFEVTAWDFPKKHALSSPAMTSSSEFVPTHEEQQDEFASKPPRIRGLLRAFVEQVTNRATSDGSPSPKPRVIFAGVAAMGLLAIGATGLFVLYRGTEQAPSTARINSQAAASTVSLTAANTAESARSESNSNSAMPAIPIANAGNFPGSGNREYADNVHAFQTTVRSSGSERKIPTRKPLVAPVVTHQPNAVLDRDLPPDVAGLNANTHANAAQSAIAALLPAGGRMKVPRLVLKSVPNYPAIAKRAFVEGEVTVDAMIDTTGKLTNMKVVSGHPLLQQAALDSLRTWKYEPAYLDDKPVPVQTSITVKFRIH